MLTISVHCVGPRYFPKLLWRLSSGPPKIRYCGGSSIKLRWFKCVSVALPADAEEPEVLYVAGSWGSGGITPIQLVDGAYYRYQAPAMPWRRGYLELVKPSAPSDTAGRLSEQQDHGLASIVYGGRNVEGRMNSEMDARAVLRRLQGIALLCMCLGLSASAILFFTGPTMVGLISGLVVAVLALTVTVTLPIMQRAKRE